MSDNVSQAIASRSQTLFEKLASNEQFSNLVMGFLGKMVWTCAQRGKAVAGIRCGAITESLGDFRFKVEYNSVLMATTTLWLPDDSVKRYVMGKSANLAKCFDVNPTLVKTFTNLVDAVDRYCRNKSITFKDFKVKKAYITPDNVFVLRSGTSDLDGFKGRGNY